jgi:hypothetical protein
MSWLSNYTCRKKGTITGAAGAGTNYQQKLKAYYDKRPIGSFTYVSTTGSDVNSCQGVATDGTYFYTTAGDDNKHLYKYNSSWVLQSGHDCSADLPAGCTQVNNIFCKDGKLYLGACDFPDSPPQGWIMVYNASDLSYDTVHSVGAIECEGCAFYDGFWWVVRGDSGQIQKWNTNWVHQTNYNLTHVAAGNALFCIGYQSLMWKDDFIYVVVHRDCQPDEKCDVYYFDGTNFTLVKRMDTPTPYCSQGLCLDPDGETVWWAERDHGGTLNDDRVVKTTIAFDNEEVGLNKHSNAGMSDVRITKSDSATIYVGGGNGWRESKIDGVFAIFWWKMPEDLGASKEIFIYYRNAGSPAWSDSGISSVMDRVNDFETGTVQDFTNAFNGGSVAASTTEKYEGSYSIKTLLAGKGVYTNDKTFWSTAKKAIDIWMLSTSNNVEATISWLVSGDNIKRVIISVESDGVEYSGSAGVKKLIAGDYTGMWVKYSVKLNADNNTFDIYAYNDKLILLGHVTGVVFSEVSRTYRDILLYDAVNYMDLIFSHKYTAPEPTWGSWNDEEVQEDKVPVEEPYTAKLGGVSLWVPPLGQQGFTITKEENDIPRFGFTLQNCSVNRTALEDHLDDAFVIYRGATPIFTGLLNCDQIEYLSIDRISVKGFAEWIELGYLIYKRMADADAESADTVMIRDAPSSWTDRTTEAGNDAINDVTVTFNSAGDGIYVGDLDKFNSLKVKYSTKGVQSGSPTFNIQYSKGSDVWDTLDCVDESRQFTKDAGTYFIFMPTLPTDWAKDTVNSSSKYWIRIVLAAGSYSTEPKLDRIWISQTDICRVQHENTAANTILGYLLDGTEYSEDATDQCPSDVIPAIRGEYESRLHWVAGLINALEWEDWNGDAQPYHWWIDDSKKVHVKQNRGTTYGDVTPLVSVLGNRINYFNIANRVFGLGGGTAINQYRAITEDQSAQDSLGKIRETTYRDSRLFDYALVKGQARKLLTQSKVAQEQIQCTMPIYDYFEGGYDICDTIKLHQSKWGIPDEREYTIRRVDISLSGVKLDIGIGREHLDNLQGNIQQQLAIHDVYMQGETSTFQAGPVEANYQRVDATTVYPVKMRIDIPSNAKAINNALISWKLGPYRADLTGTGTGGGHFHEPSTPNTGTGGGHDHGAWAGAGGGHTPTEWGKAHTHVVTGTITLSFQTNDKTFLDSGITTTQNDSVPRHTHPNPTTAANNRGHTHTLPTWTGAYDNDNEGVVDYIYPGSDCVEGSCITGWDNVDVPSTTHYHSLGGNTGGVSQNHTHTQGVTEAGSAHHHPLSVHNFAVIDTTTMGGAFSLGVAAADDPAHIHTINSVGDHSDHSISTLDDFSLSVPNTDTEPDFSLPLTYGMKEIPGGTVMQLIVNGVEVGTYDGDATDVKIRGFLSNGNNNVILQPIVTANEKGSAQLDATIKVFIDTE